MNDKYKKKKKSKLTSASAGPISIAEDFEQISPQDRQEDITFSEEISLSKVKNLWLFGDWVSLVNIDIELIKEHHDRAYLVLLVASAHLQIEAYDKARYYVQSALNWGASNCLVASVLVAGVHNTLGRLAALSNNEESVSRHFVAAVGIPDNAETRLLGHARAVREMSDLGLLPQAVGLVTQELNAIEGKVLRPHEQQAKIKILQTELDLLHGNIVIAQQRQQLFHSHADVFQPEQQNHVIDILEQLRKISVSQLGQDLWVLEKTGFKRDGFFVEFGATDGVTLSNTWLLEKEFAWKGICAEPNPKFFEQLRKNRRCIVADACISGQTGSKVKFILADAYGGIASFANLDSHTHNREAYIDAGEVINLETISLNDFLIQQKAPTVIDYLSIDTEGSEFEILSAFPFESWDVRLLTVEHNFTPLREEIRTLLSSKGYQCVEREWDDWFFRE